MMMMRRMRANGGVDQGNKDKPGFLPIPETNRINRPKSDEAMSSEPDKKPKKCVVIKKKKIGDGLEKIEMRYVSYNKIEPGVRTTNLEIIADASNYLNQRAKDVDYRDESKNSKTAVTNTEETITTTLKEGEARKLRLCIPILFNIRARFEESAKNEKVSVHRRRQSMTMKALCDEILEEASYTLENQHPISNELMKKIHNINSLSRRILNNESKVESFTSDCKELAFSKSKTET